MLLVSSRGFVLAARKRAIGVKLILAPVKGHAPRLHSRLEGASAASHLRRQSVGDVGSDNWCTRGLE
jgi:hypothetical protein